ncbi:MAG: T9SS type A sorting domain-containing protein [Bacteroidota bacterium]|jgi:hypothetical protein
MKNIFLLYCLLLLFNISKAQINFEHSYGVYNEVPVHITTLENSGDKFVVYDEFISTLYIYNLNHTLWKTITVDTNALGVSPATLQFGEGVSISYLKENLFDLDGQVEFIWQFSIFSNPTQIISAIIDESGLPLAVFDSCYIINDMEGYYQSIRNTSSGTKLITENGFTNEYKVYSLPGTLTCNPCGGVSGINNPNNANNRLTSKAYPVPSEKSVTIQYELPNNIKSGFLIVYNSSGAEVMKLQIGPAFKDVALPVESLQAGTYIYAIQSQQGENISSGRFILH